MSERLKHFLVMLVMSINLINLFAPVSYAGGSLVEVSLPIDELEGLIQQLQDAGNQLVGAAGIQIRESIRELSDQMRQRIDQMKAAAQEVIKTVAAELRQILNDLAAKASALLQEVKTMIRDSIKCIDEALANRIAQIKDAIFAILEKVSDTIRDAVNLIYQKSGSLIDKGSYNIKVIMDSTLNTIAKVAILIIMFVILFWLIRTLWKGTFPKIKIIRYGVPILMVLVLGAGAFLLFSSTALGKILGSHIVLPNAKNACQEGNRLYTEFLDLKNNAADKSSLQSKGDSALENLSTCIYATMDRNIGRGSQEKIDDIAAVLYPPPPPPNQTPVLADCGTAGSVNPGWHSIWDLRKIGRLQAMVASRTLKESVIAAGLRDTTQYFNDVKARIHVDPGSMIKNSVMFRRTPR